MRHKFIAIAFVVILCLPSCVECYPEKENAPSKHLEMAVLFHQKAAEYRALCYQAFNIANYMLEADLENNAIKKQRAIVFDIDETILDNSPYQAKCVLNNFSYPEQWAEWCNLGKADTIPGALEFIKNAHSKGVAIFYITNRKSELFEGTKKNLLQHGFPLENDSFLLMKEGDNNSKESRRQEVLKNYNISLLVGDNLADFSAIFENLSTEKRNSITDSLKIEFGTRYIVLPNPMYGDWEMALYNNSKLTEEERVVKRTENLMGF